MNNFEEAIKKIETLEEENLNLKVKLKAALWKISNTPVGVSSTNIQVGFNDRIEKIKHEADEAMARFTGKIHAKVHRHKGKKSGS